jgi:hypothetical protein
MIIYSMLYIILSTFYPNRHVEKLSFRIIWPESYMVYNIALNCGLENLCLWVGWGPAQYRPISTHSPRLRERHKKHPVIPHQQSTQFIHFLCYSAEVYTIEKAKFAGKLLGKRKLKGRFSRYLIQVAFPSSTFQMISILAPISGDIHSL